MRRLCLLSILALTACGGDDLMLPNEGEPANIVILRGDQQNGTVGQALPDSLVIRVTDRFNNPVAGVEVTWVPDNGGAVDPATSTTDGQGRAGTMRTLGSQPGTYITQANVAGFTGDPTVFVTTGLAAQLTFVTQPGAIATSGSPLDPQPVLQLSDPEGNPIARGGVSVTVQISSGGGTLGGTTTSTSDDAGLVTFSDLVISGSAGVRTLIFAADGFASAISTPVALGVGAPASMALVTGDGQTATVGSALPVAATVVVKDGTGNPVSGVPVNFVVTGGGGSVTGQNPITGADGIAAVGAWTLGKTTGANTLEARIGTSGVSGNPVVFHATGTAGPLSPAKSTVTASPTTIGASTGSVFSTVTVKAVDDFGNPLPNIPVVISATGTGNVIVQPTGPTNAQGQATGKFSSTSPGDHVVSATVGGSAAGKTATVKVNAGPPVASTSTAQVPAGTAGQPSDVVINLRDASGNPVTGAPGSIAVIVSGANSASGPVAETGGGAYLFRYTPLTAGTDQVQVQVSGADVPGSPFSSVVSPGPADPGRSVANVPANFFFSTTFTVTAVDAQGNLVGHGGESVTISVDGIGPLTVVDNGNGAYTADFAPGVGTYTVNITVNGGAIAGSPFTSTRVF